MSKNPSSKEGVVAYLNNHFLLKEVRKKAKSLCREKNDKKNFPLGQCLDTVAKDYGYTNWYELYQHYKHEYETRHGKDEFDPQTWNVPLFQSASALGLIYNAHDSRENKLEISDADVQKHLKNIDYHWKNAKAEEGKNQIEAFFTGQTTQEEKRFTDFIEQWLSMMIAFGINRINFYCQKESLDIKNDKDTTLNLQQEHYLTYQKTSDDKEYRIADVQAEQPIVHNMPDILNALSLKYFDNNLQKIENNEKITIKLGPYVVKMNLQKGLSENSSFMHYVLYLDNLAGEKYDAYNEYFLNMIEKAVANQCSDIHLEFRHTMNIRMRSNSEMLDFKTDEQEKQMGNEMLRYVCARYFNIDLMRTQYGRHKTIKHNGRRIRMTLLTLRAYPEGYDTVIRVLPYDTHDELQQKYKQREKGGIGYESSHHKIVDHALKNAIVIASNQDGTHAGCSNHNLVTFVNDSLQAEIYDEAEAPEPDKMNHNNLIIGSITQNKTDFLQNLLKTNNPACYVASALFNHAEGGYKNTISDTIEHLKDWGIIKQMLSLKTPRSLILGHQNIMLMICPHCCTRLIPAIKENRARDEDRVMYQKLVRLLGQEMVDNHPITIRNHDGYKKSARPDKKIRECSHCRNSGWDGRSFVSEILVLDNAMMKEIEQGHTQKVIDNWKEDSDKKLLSGNWQGKTVLHHALFKMLQGILDPYDIEKRFHIDFDKISLF